MSIVLHNDLDLTALRAFRAVVREGSFSAAAAALHTAKSTLSKRVADLESDLGVRLIERSTRTLRVTSDGHVLAVRADRLLGEADDIRRSLGDRSAAPCGHLRIAVPAVLGHGLMGRAAAAFRRLHPGITLEVHFLDRAPDLLEHGFDGCIRFGQPEDSGQVARLMMQDFAVLAASPDTPGLDALRHPRDLSNLPLVGLAAAWQACWTLCKGGETVEVPVKTALSLGSHIAVRDAVAAGAGPALLPRFLAEEAFASGLLVPVLPGWATQARALYFVYPSAGAVTARLRLLIDFLGGDLNRPAQGLPHGLPGLRP